MEKKKKILRHLVWTAIFIFSAVTFGTAQTLDSFNPSANLAVSDIEVLANGKMYVGGQFTTVGGGTRRSFARLNADGTVDSTFADVGLDSSSTVTEIIVQPDGKILLSGSIFTISGQTRNRIARLNADGTLDTGFDTAFTPPVSVNRIALQSDGKIIAPVSFGSGWTVLRRNSNGSADASFSSLDFNNTVTQVLVQTDGKVLACGGFTTVNGTANRGIARLNANGSLDTTFNANMPSGSCIRMTLAPNGKIYVGGTFTSIGGQTRTYFARLNADGTADASFQTATIAGGTLQTTNSAIPLPNGKVIVAGAFTSVSGQPRVNLVRLNADGSLDTTFINMGVTGTVSTSIPQILARQPDGKIVIGGDFIIAGGVNRFRLARITTDDPVATTDSPYDFDGDGKSDISIFRPSVGEWWYLKSSTGGNSAAQFGLATDKIVPGDYTGDGKSDFAFFRPSTGQWFVLRSENFSFFAVPFGTATDVPVPADYDSDGKTDIAVYRPSTSVWYIQKSGGGTDILSFGANGDKPVVGDFDGDAKADVAIYRPSTGQWWIRRSSDASVFALQFGVSTDRPVQGDYTGDGKTDIAIFRPATGQWFVLRSEDLSFYSFNFGISGDIPATGDFDGDGKFDAAIFRPSNNTWYISQTTAGTAILPFGVTNDLPVPSAFIP